MRPDALAATIAADRAAGYLPIAIVATVGTTSSTVGRPGRADRGHRRARGAVAAHRFGLRGCRRAPARAPGALRRLGARRFDRRQPAQVAVHAARRLAAPVPADGRCCATAFSLVPEYLLTLDRATPVHDYNEYTPQLGRRFRALKLWIHLRWFGLEGLRRRIAAPPRACRVVRGPGRRRAGLGAPGARPVLDGLLPLASARLERHRRGAGRGQRGDHGRGQPHGRGLPVPHPPRRPLHDPRRDRQPAHRGRATSSVRGRCCASPRPSARHRRRDARAARHQVLRDAGGASRLVRRQPRDGRRPLARLPPEGDAASRRISWSDAVDEALCVGWIDSIRKRLDDTRSAQRFTPRRKGSNWSAINVDKVAALTAEGRMRPAGLRAFEGRTAAKTASTRTNGRGRSSPTRSSSGSGPCRPPGPTGSDGRRRTAGPSRTG